jgi:hypothetical protein
MAGEWAGSGSLPPSVHPLSTALGRRHALPPAFQPTLGVLHVFLPPSRPSARPAPDNSRHPNPALTGIPALRSLPEHPPPPTRPDRPGPGPSAPRAPCALAANTPRPAPRLRASPGNPSHEVRASLPPDSVQSDSLLVPPGESALAATTGLPVLPPGPGVGPATLIPAPLRSRAALLLPDPPPLNQAPTITKDSASRVRSARLALARSPPGSQQSPSRRLAPGPGLPIGPRTLLAGGVILP